MDNSNDFQEGLDNVDDKILTSINTTPQQNDQLPEREFHEDDFRDLMCFFMWALCMCPCVGAFAIFFQQKAAESYWIGDYTTASLKQAIAVKFCIATLLIGLGFWIFIFFIGLSLEDVLLKETGN